MKRTLFLPITIILLYGASVCLNVNFQKDLLPKKAEIDIIQRIFGSLRVFVGDWAFMKAEEYHHRGLPFEQALAYHKGESILADRSMRAVSGKTHEEEIEGAKGNVPLYTQLYSQVKVTGDSHLKPVEEKEVLPWFYVEVAFNPHDVRGYVLGAYWLERVGDKSASVKFLLDGEKNNPNSAEILGALGEFYFKANDPAKAMDYLSRAHALWKEAKGINAVSTPYEESDRFLAFDLLGDIYLKKGDNEKALQLYTELLKFGANPKISQKIAQIEGKQ